MRIEVDISDYTIREILDKISIECEDGK